uniref:Zona pellucida sperm-binding protein 3 n=1 Tax=Latimeria chalumnae TaxID=7897 RepID=H2ZZG9_LATCH
MSDQFQSSPEFKVVSKLHTVTVECKEAWMVVTVKKDLFGTGHLVKASDLSLGPQKCSFIKASQGDVVFEVELHACGNSLGMTEDHLIYSTELVYIPTPLANEPILRTNGAVIPVRCFYPRKQNVSSKAIKPTWIPFASTISAEERLAFSLRLMNDDFSKVRDSNIYYLGDVLHVEASVAIMNHVPLLLFIDSCVATLTPDKDSSPRYPIIDYHGCLVDGRSEDSSSGFRPPRPSASQLRFNVDAFRFYQDSRTVIYITCHLKVTAVDEAPDSMNKACSFRKPVNEWMPMEGDANICSCCETKNCGLASKWQGSRWGRDVASKLGNVHCKWEGDQTIGPLINWCSLGDQSIAASNTWSEPLLIMLGVVVTVSLCCVVLVLCKTFRKRTKNKALKCPTSVSH